MPLELDPLLLEYLVTFFSFGFLCFFTPALLAALYLLGFGMRCLAAYADCKPMPTERAGFLLIVSMVFGLFLGSLLQTVWDKGETCVQDRQPIAACLLVPGLEKPSPAR